MEKKEKKFMDEEGNYDPLIQSWIGHKKVMEDREQAYITAIELEKDANVAKYAKLFEDVEKIEIQINKGKNIDIDVLTELFQKINELETHGKKIKDWKKLNKRRAQYITSENLMKYLEKQSPIVAEYAIIHKED